MGAVGMYRRHGWVVAASLGSLSSSGCGVDPPGFAGGPPVDSGAVRAEPGHLGSGRARPSGGRNRRPRRGVARRRRGLVRGAHERRRRDGHDLRRLAPAHLGHRAVLRQALARRWKRLALRRRGWGGRELRHRRTDVARRRVLGHLGTVGARRGRPEQGGEHDKTRGKASGGGAREEHATPGTAARTMGRRPSPAEMVPSR